MKDNNEILMPLEKRYLQMILNWIQLWIIILETKLLQKIIKWKLDFNLHTLLLFDICSSKCITEDLSFEVCSKFLSFFLFLKE